MGEILGLHVEQRGPLRLQGFEVFLGERIDLRFGVGFLISFRIGVVDRNPVFDPILAFFLLILLLIPGGVTGIESAVHEDFPLLGELFFFFLRRLPASELLQGAEIGVRILLVRFLGFQGFQLLRPALLLFLGELGLIGLHGHLVARDLFDPLPDDPVHRVVHGVLGRFGLFGRLLLRGRPGADDAGQAFGREIELLRRDGDTRSQPAEEIVFTGIGDVAPLGEDVVDLGHQPLHQIGGIEGVRNFFVGHGQVVLVRDSVRRFCEFAKNS